MACDSHIPKVQTMFSPSAPHFSKIILGQIPGNTKLQIPKTFWVKYCESLSSQAFLKLPCGSTWEVGLTKSSDGNVWMDKGWKAFAQHCSLSCGNLLVFRYEGNCRFNVIIFNKTMVEIDYLLILTIMLILKMIFLLKYGASLHYHVLSPTRE
ncbi:hypothetical protein CsatA_025936 [Cannabis sativa]